MLRNDRLDIYVRYFAQNSDIRFHKILRALSRAREEHKMWRKILCYGNTYNF